MQLQPLTLDHKPLFEKCASQFSTKLSSYRLAPIYVWCNHFNFSWVVLDDYLCVFAKQGNDYFMPLLPIPCAVDEPTYLKTVRDTYKFMTESNRNPQFARIENVPKDLLPVFNTLGFEHYEKETEYVYRTDELAELRGNRYKQQRNAYNAFITRNPSVEYTQYQSSDKNGCLELYEDWRKNRVDKYADPIYQAMLDDSQSAHQIGISHAEELGLVGRVVRINGQLCAYTFGYELNKDTFCILFEISDLKIKGLAQFMYREFCKELMASYKWINAMDDSGLENIKRVKLAYNPNQLIPTYNITRNNENCTHLS